MLEKENTTNKIDNTILQEIKYIPSDTENIKIFKPEYQIKKPDALFLQFTVVAGITLSMVGGSVISWPSPAVVKLKLNDTNTNPLGRPITTVEVSKLLGVPGMLSLIGALLLPKLADIIGRKKSLHVLGFTMFLSLLGLAFSSSVNLMITFLALAQIGFSGVLGTLPIYLTEICEDHNRSKYGCLMSLCFPLGQLYVYTTGTIFSLRIFTLLILLPLVPFLILFFFVSESPTHSLTKGKQDECFKSLQRLRGNKSNKELEEDFNKLKLSLKIVGKSNKSSIMDLFKTKEGRIGLLLVLLPNILQYACGVPVVMTLLAPIFNDSGSNLSGDTIAIIVGCVKIMVFVLTTFIIEKTGRKPMLIISAVGVGTSALVLGISFYLKYINSPLLNHLQWVPIVSVMTYVISYAIGLGPIPINVIGEFFPSGLRSTASTIIITVTTTCLTVYSSCYPIVAEAIGAHWCMWMFSASSLLGACIVYFVFPETRGKSFTEIQEILQNY